jgi:uncharacterized protein (DUF1330 family)
MGLNAENQMAAYCFLDVREVIDLAELKEYRSRVLATVQLYGGRYLVVGGKCDVVEGTWRPTYPVLIRFPDLDKAYAWYGSEEYKDLKALRLRATRCDAVFIEAEANEFVSGD